MKTNESGRIGFIPMFLIVFFAALVMIAVMYIVSPVIQWKETNLAGKSYQINENCFVTKVHSGGIGVTLQATDNNWHGKSIVQVVIINPNEFGGALVQKEYVINGQLDFGSGFSLNGYEYDVFYSKCREDARRMPLEVRKAFLGHYDLMSK